MPSSSRRNRLHHLWGLALFPIFFSACQASWIMDPLADYLQKKTGLQIQVRESEWGVRPLRLTCRDLTIRSEDKSPAVELFIERLDLQIGWGFSPQAPYWPSFWVDRLTVERPRGTIRTGTGGPRGDWRARLKRMPDIRAVQVNHFTGKIIAGRHLVLFPSGLDLRGTFGPETGVILAFLAGTVRVDSGGELGASVQGLEGELALAPAEDPVRWRAGVRFSRTETVTRAFSLVAPAGRCSLRGQGSRMEIRDLEGRLSRFQWNWGGLLFEGSGEARVTGAVRLETGRDGGGLIPEVTLAVFDSRFSVKKGDKNLSGHASGNVHLGGSGTRPRVQGAVRLKQVGGDFFPIRWRGLESRIVLEGTWPDLMFPAVEARAEDFSWQGREASLAWTLPEASFNARILAERVQIRIENLRLTSREWGTFRGDLDFDRQLGAIPNGSVRLKDFPLEKIINPWAGGRLQEHMPVSGMVNWNRVPGEAPWSFQFDLEAADWNLREGRPFGGVKNLGTRGRVRLIWDPVRQAVEGEGNQRLSRGTISPQGWLVRFSEAPLTLAWKGRLTYGNGLPSATGSVRGCSSLLGRWEAFGHLSWGEEPLAYKASISAEGIPLASLIYRGFGDGEGNKSPGLPGVELAGSLAAELSLSGGAGGVRVRGALRGEGLRAGGRDPLWNLEIKKLDWPVDLEQGNPGGPESDAALQGRLAVGDFSLKGFRAGALDIPISARINRYQIPETLTVPFFGGKLILDQPVLDWENSALRLESGVSIRGLALPELLPGKGIQGSLEGDLGRIRIDSRQGKAPGTLTGAVFGGRMEVRNISLDHPFRSDRSLSGAVAFHHIDLEQVTGLFSFGRITGHIRGRIEELRLGPKGPERFHLILETEEVEGVPKRITVQAVENVSLLGTGSGELGGLERGINRWFQEYAYEKIGLRCVLQDGLFSLRGTIFEDGTEYLVKSPGWYGIDVVNKNPDNEIAFSDMIERVRRLGSKPDQGGADGVP